MINQRGQAFSVFQLLIAAIVAIAILGILFMILNQIKPPAGDPLTEIKNSLSTVKSGGTVETSNFDITSGLTIHGTDFEQIVPIDSIIFFVDTKGGMKYDSSNGLSIEDVQLESESYQTLRYKGLTSLPAKATVTCASTGERLLSDLSSMSDLEGDESALCLGDDTIQPCCAIIIKRG